MKKILITLFIIMSVLLINNNEQIIIPSESIRIRIIANSNSSYDQKIKNSIKKDINKFVEKILKNTNSIYDARNKIINNIQLITNLVDKKLKDLNYDKEFSINYGFNYFPEKTFKGIQYDSGNYESLVITLGKGIGDNFWCVLYPPLCNIDDEKEEYEYRSIIKDILDNYLT